MSKKRKKNANQLTTQPDTIQNSSQDMLFNSLSSLVGVLSNGTNIGGEQISQVDTLFKNNRWYMLSNMRQLLSQMYVEHGLVQTLVDQPVEDATRKGVKFQAESVSEDEIIELERVFKRKNLFPRVINQANKWNRLYGGSGIIIVTGQDPETPLRPLKQGDKLDYKAVDMWELFHDQINVLQPDSDLSELSGGLFNIDNVESFNYYGHKIHKSRVIILQGKEPPSFIRPRLRGWGMSELERLVRSINQYLKNQDVVFELLDEAKIDVYKIANFNQSLMTKNGTAAINKRVQLSNQVKNYQNAIVMDTEDEYEQKSMSFAGLDHILAQIRQGVACDLKIPMSKLFGISSAGFSSGEDDIENYNAMLETEIRAKNQHVILKIAELESMVLFGDVIEDIDFEWETLRVLTAEQEQTTKDSKLNRVLQAFGSGLIETKEAKESINKDNLLPIQIEVNDEIYDNPNVNIDEKEA